MDVPIDARRSMARDTTTGDAPAVDGEIHVTRVQHGFCARCGEPAGPAHECERDARLGAELEPDRYCTVCGSRLTVQVMPQGVEAECLRCARRARRSVT